MYIIILTVGEALFDELVKHEHDVFIYMLHHHYNGEVMVNVSEATDIRVWKQMLRSFLAELKPYILGIAGTHG